MAGLSTFVLVLSFTSPLAWMPEPSEVTSNHGPSRDGAPLHEQLRLGAIAGGCLDHSRLVRSVAGWLGYDHIDRRIVIDVDMPRSDRVGFRVRLDDVVRAERMLDPAPTECADVHAALGLAIALAIDASVLESLGVPPPAPAVQPMDSSAVDRGPVVQPTTRQGIRVTLSVGAIAAFQVLPRPAFGADVMIDLGPVPWLDLRIGGFVVSGPRFGLGSGEVSAVLGAATLEVCPSRGWGRVRLRLCTGASAGGLRAVGRGYMADLVTVLPWMAMQGGGDVSIALSQLIALRVEARASVPVIRPQVVEMRTGQAVAYQQVPPVGAIVTFGVSMRFGAGWAMMSHRQRANPHNVRITQPRPESTPARRIPGRGDMKAQRGNPAP